ncbi:AzlC family ABC transporter permease [Salinispira pacifica]|uniref:Branched-chain amino acid transport protein azlC n=1 Tax=Salinispira pacifica TaxID=1307761 RepID=V5WM12_9SPIO|nr:AzlC family ABC transporter permease [Salinispira pacifica]AHC16141.1 Branched-chain amino acid transport protein azlC [Salinispira pacifica]
MYLYVYAGYGYNAGMDQHVRTFISALRSTIPVFFGYMSIGIAFGFLLVTSGVHWIWALIISVAVFAGAAQFLAVGLISSGSSPVEIGIAVFLINARHMVYGLSLLERFQFFRRFKAYIIFGLTDETYGLLTTVEAPEGSDPEVFDFYITLLNHSYWILGSVSGALLGRVLPYDAPGIEFSMTALFTVLLIEQIKSIRKAAPFVLALGICILLHLLQVREQLLLPAIILSALGTMALPADENGGAS